MIKIRSVFVAVGATLLVQSAFALDYTPGFRWDRSDDWTPGALPGGTVGNPDTDAKGNAVWQYEWTMGGALGSANPWYLGQKHLMVWDDDWWGANGQANWAKGYLGPGSDNNENPPISRYTMAHDLSQYKNAWDYMPVVRWINPAGNGTVVDIGGTLKAEWAGWGVSPNVDIDLIIGKKDASANTFELLYSGTVSNPTPGLSNPPYPFVNVALDIDGVRMDSGDSLLISIRAQTAPFALPNWVVLYDDVKIQYVGFVPEPSTYALSLVGLGVCGLVVGRSRRRTVGMCAA